MIILVHLLILFYNKTFVDKELKMLNQKLFYLGFWIKVIF